MTRLDKKRRQAQSIMQPQSQGKKIQKENGGEPVGKLVPPQMSLSQPQKHHMKWNASFHFKKNFFPDCCSTHFIPINIHVGSGFPHWCSRAISVPRYYAMRAGAVHRKPSYTAIYSSIFCCQKYYLKPVRVHEE